MSSLAKIKRNRLIKQLNKGKEVIVSVFMFLVFLIIFVVIIKGINPVKEDVPNYSELSRNPYAQYEELLNRTDLKKIMSNRQFLEMRYDEDVIKEEDPFERDDPFMEKFGDEYDDGDVENESDEDENEEGEEDGDDGEGEEREERKERNNDED